MYVGHMAKLTLRKYLWIIVFILGQTQLLYSQRDTYTFAYLGIQDPDSALSATEIRVLENRLSSFFVQLSTSEPYSFLFPEDRVQVLARLNPSAGQDLAVRELGSDWLPLARGVISGEVNRLGNSLFLDLFIHNRSNGRLLLTRQDVFQSFDELIGQLQTTAYGLFGIQTTPVAGLSQGLAQQQTGPLFMEATIPLIVGTWIGDAGLGRVSIQRDGSGLAQLIGDETMRVQVRVENGLVRIRQDEPNAPKMYLSVFPYSVASQIVGLARPMTWEFRLTADGRRLVGNKFTSFITVEQGTVTRVDNTYFREAEWARAD
jgi:hypothetical protein